MDPLQHFYKHIYFCIYNSIGLWLLLSKCSFDNHRFDLIHTHLTLISLLCVSYMCQRLVVLQQMQPLILVKTTGLQHQGKVLDVAQREAVLQGGDHILQEETWKRIQKHVHGKITFYDNNVFFVVNMGVSFAVNSPVFVYSSVSN